MEAKHPLHNDLAVARQAKLQALGASCKQPLKQEKLWSKSTQVCTIVLLIAMAVVSIGASMGLVSMYTVTLLGKYMCYAIMALSLDLIWGYLGILSLGHCAFFALGGYAMGMYLTLQIGTQGVYGSTLPDFMVFLNWNHLPWYWQGSHYLVPSLLLSLLVPALLALGFGYITFKSRVSGVYLSIITQALTYALMLAFFLNELGFGGNNGLTDFKTIASLDVTADSTRIVLFSLTSLVLVGCFIGARYLMCSRLGRLMIAVRDSESRMRFIGYRPENVKLVIFVLAAAMAGLAGALFVPQVGIINPGEFSPLNSIELVICVALGGRGYLYGAIVGAIVLNLVKTIFTAVWPEGWLFVLGALFVVVTVFLPYGLCGLFRSLLAGKKGSDDSDSTGTLEPEPQEQAPAPQAPSVSAVGASASANASASTSTARNASEQSFSSARAPDATQKTVSVQASAAAVTLPVNSTAAAAMAVAAAMANGDSEAQASAAAIAAHEAALEQRAQAEDDALFARYAATTGKQHAESSKAYKNAAYQASRHELQQSLVQVQEVRHHVTA